MKKSKNFILISMIFIILFFLFNSVNVYATYSDKGSEALEKALESADGTSFDGFKGGTLSEADIANKKFDASNVNFKNLNDLNIAVDDLWQFVRWILSILSVFGTISSFFILTKSFLQLAYVTDHPMDRKKVYTDILTSGIVTILFAGLSLFMTIFYKTFENFFKNITMLSSDYKSAFALFLVEYKYFIIGIDAILSLTLIIFLIKDILNLAASGNNPNQRASAIKGILYTIIAIVGCGAVGLLVGIFSGLFIV